MVVPLAMGWRHLLFEHWPMDPATLAPMLPSPLAIDTFDGAAWLGVIPFTNVAVRPAGLPPALGIALPELNVRTYVTHDGTPGVYFFSLDAQGVASVLGARLFHHLPYYYARIALRSDGDRVHFHSRRRHPGARAAAYEASYRPTGEAFRASEDPFADFLVERYRLFTDGWDGELRYTAVDHDPWTLAPADASVRTNTMLAATGLARPERDPVYHYSPGLDVVAAPSRRV